MTEPTTGTEKSGLHWDIILQQMLSEAARVGGANWQPAEQYADMEFRKLAVTGKAIIDNIQNGKFNDTEAHILLDGQKNTAMNIIATSKLMDLVRAQVIVNAAMAVLNSVLNTALGAIKFV